MTPILLAMARKAGFSDSIEGWMGEAYADRLEAFAKLIIEHEAAKQSNDEPLMWLMPDGKTVDKWARQFYRDEVGIPLYERPKSPDQAEYERGFIDGMQKQMQSSVDKAVNAMAAKSADTPVAWMDADDNLFYTEEDAYKTGVQPIQPLMRGSNPTDGQRYEPGSFKWNTPADEPVAWATQLNEYAHIKWGAKRPEYPMVYEFPLYTSPQPAQPSKPWVGLTDAEIRDWWRVENGLEDCNMAKLVDFTLAVRAIEVKLREKNA